MSQDIYWCRKKTYATSYTPQVRLPDFKMVIPWKSIVLVAPVILTGKSSIDGFPLPSPLPSTIPPPPPISVPVWSFATAAAALETKTSMNIMTFCSPVSVSSPKLWALSFYHGTLTKDSFLGNDVKAGIDPIGVGNRNGRSVGILQLLKYDHRHLVPILGKKSGRDVDKSVLSREEGFPWVRIPGSDDTDADSGGGRNNQGFNFQLLPGCALYLQVESSSPSSLIDAGDHIVAICEVTRTGVWEQNDDGEGFDGGQVRWLDQAIDGKSMPLSLGKFDETNALYTGRLREEGIL